ncbi:TPA: hypothetical protein DDX46_04900 [Candidatus Saccharibacteria bacterium]|nr:MAG: exported protein of unknown function [Candidatus Saccharibacteria bacterium GW2011_GWC2_44_17]OGL34139.1 MAG: hypothetical protein A3E20_04530 [Candidatus Saccharibacteria bacterium RIFCSPHIGHO2_12_FULL_47_16]HBH78055.1 hypothetical protein [Candidatus Saccharibacteria bacterium]
MKQRSTTPVSNTSFAVKASLVAIAILMAVATPIQIGKVVKADEFDERIKTIQNEIDQYQTKANELKGKADTLQQAVDALTNQKNTIQAQINLKQAEFDKLTADIAANEKSIATNQDVLGDTIASLYVDGKISTLEMLASSKNIGEYVDKQEYQSSVRDTLTKTINDIKKTKKQLEQQKTAVERNLEDQKAQREVLAQKEAEQASLVAQTRGEEAAYHNLSGEREQQKQKLQEQQQAAIEAAMRRAAAASGGGGSQAVAGDPRKGGYPANLANSDYYNPVVDNWGMYSRQCVSYTAWKVFQKNGYMPYWGGRGNANQWPGNARAAGIGTGTTPRAGSVGVIMAGQYGHVVWVESVNSDGTINISQYNYFNAGGSGWGHYSEMYNVSPRAYDVYIYF